MEPGAGSSDRSLPENRVVIPQGSGLRRVPWTDLDGATWVSVLPPGAPDSEAAHYPRIGPPPIAAMLAAAGWPAESAARVQAELVQRGILTRTEARTPEGRAAVTAALRHALATDAQQVIDLYLSEG